MDITHSQATALQAFETTAVLSNGTTYTSPVIAYVTDGSSQVQTEVLSDQNGSMLFTFYSDDAGTDAIRSLTVPYTAADGYRLYAAPTFGRSVRYTFTNNSGADQTDFYFGTKIMNEAISPQMLSVDGFISPAMITTLQRAILTGLEGDGNYSNITAVETSNDAGTYHSLQTVSGARPSELTGRTAVSLTLDDLTADALLLTNTVGKTVYVTDILLTIENDASNTPGSAKLRDGTTVAGAVVIPINVEEGPTGGTALTTINISFTEPVAFTAGIFLEEAAGTLTVSGLIQGYQE